MLWRYGNALVGGSGNAGVRELEMVFLGSEARAGAAGGFTGWNPGTREECWLPKGNIFI